MKGFSLLLKNNCFLKIIFSSLLCINFAGGDDQTQWTATLDKHETVQCVCVGGEFVAIATSSHMIRGFSTAGFQLAPFMLPGAPVAMSGYNNVLFVVYHTAPGKLVSHLCPYSLRITSIY